MTQTILLLIDDDTGEISKYDTALIKVDGEYKHIGDYIKLNDNDTRAIKKILDIEEWKGAGFDV